MMNALQFACRQLRKNPGFTAVAVLTLALSREVVVETMLISALGCLLVLGIGLTGIILGL